MKRNRRENPKKKAETEVIPETVDAQLKDGLDSAATESASTPASESASDDSQPFKITWLDNHRPDKQRAPILRLGLTEIHNRNIEAYREKRRCLAEGDANDADADESKTVSDCQYAIPVQTENQPETLANSASDATGQPVPETPAVIVSKPATQDVPAPQADASVLSPTQTRRQKAGLVSSIYDAVKKSSVFGGSDNEPRYIVGVDVGSSGVRAVVSEVVGKRIKIIGAAREPVYGAVRKGEIIEIARASASVREAVNRAASQAGVRVFEIFVTANGEYMRGLNTRAGIGIGNEEREVAGMDMSRVLRLAGNIDLPAERCKLHILKQKFAVDSLTELDNPAGLTGIRLECEAHLITAPKNAIQNLKKTVRDADFRCAGVSMSVFAAAQSALSDDERRIGSLLIDIGAGTTGITIFVGGVPRMSAVLPIGGDHINNDIIEAFKVASATAEKLKCLHGVAKKALLTENERQMTLPALATDGQERRKISRGELAGIIEQRVEELFLLVRDSVEREGFAPDMSAGIVVTGGASLLPGLTNKANDILGARPRLGVPMVEADPGVSIEDPRMSAAVGLVVYAAKQPKDDASTKGWFGAIMSGCKKMFVRVASNF
ncbi:MAG: cell division protein FtsA [Planctomycetota bacterium]